MASERKRRNHIFRLQDENGIWVDGQNEICGVVHRYFTHILNSIEESSDGGGSNFLNVVHSIITPDQNNDLTRDFCLEEFTRVVNQMHGDKASGADEFNPAFCQNCWTILGPNIFTACVSWLQRGEFPDDLNHTNVVLSPKCQTPQSMEDLRPILLCNMIYKILANVLCNRLKGALSNLVDKDQSAFISGRNIQYIVLIAFEILHKMKNRRMCRKGEVAIKIDISKAYDRVDWNYSRLILMDLLWKNCR